MNVRDFLSEIKLAGLACYQSTSNDLDDFKERGLLADFIKAYVSALFYNYEETEIISQIDAYNEKYGSGVKTDELDTEFVFPVTVDYAVREMKLSLFRNILNNQLYNFILTYKKEE